MDREKGYQKWNIEVPSNRIKSYELRVKILEVTE